MEEEFVLKDYQIGEFAKRMGVSPIFSSITSKPAF